MGEILDFPQGTIEVSLERRVQPDVVDALKQALILAERGQIQAIAMTWVDDKGHSLEGWVNTNYPHHLMAGISYLASRYAAQQTTEQSFEPDLPTVS